MKKTMKQIGAVLLALAMTVSLVTAMAVSTSAASVKTTAVGTGSYEEGGTNHCCEDDTTYYPYTVPEGVLTNPDGSPRYEDDTEEPSTEGPTTEPLYETLELYCVLTITRADLEDALVETGMNQQYPGYSPKFTRDVNGLEVSDKPYTATVDTFSCIYPDQLVYTDSVEFYVRKEGVVHFRCYAPSGNVTVRGDGIEIVPDVTYPTSEPGETGETVWTSVPDVTYPTTLPPVWTSTPQEPTTQPEHFGSFTFGDANLDGKVDVADATVIQQIAAEQATPDWLSEKTADADGDGVITVTDATCVQKYAAEFPTGTGNIGQAWFVICP